VLWRPHYPGKNEQQVWTLFNMERGQEVKCFPSILQEPFHPVAVNMAILAVLSRVFQ